VEIKTGDCTVMVERGPALHNIPDLDIGNGMGGGISD
jgi:hypothetical protein